MQRWEYCEVRGSQIIFYTNSGAVAKSMQSREHAVAQLGLEGWEAFAADGGWIYFKRPKRS
jgi:hypothetical protein